MATVKKTGKQKEVLTKDHLITLYMDEVLEKESIPVTVYKFCKTNDVREEEFYSFFGNFDALKEAVWVRFFEHSLDVMQRSAEYGTFMVREKVLTFYYTFFEVLTANRSYVMLSLRESKSPLKNLEQLKGLRKEVKAFARDLVKEANDEKQMKLVRNSGTVFSEAIWLQLLFLMKFWMDDASPKFESTDIAIEKSVNTVFDLMDNTALERVLDLGKFLWKEKMA